MQDVLGKVRESMHEGEWSKGTEKDVIATAKLHSPLACASKELEKVGILTKGYIQWTSAHPNRLDPSLLPLPREYHDGHGFR